MPKSNNNKSFKIVEHQITIGINQEWFEEWQEYREHDLKKPMTPRAIKMAERWLLKYPEAEQERLISHAIMNNWRGLHWVEPAKESSTRQTTLLQDLTNTDWAN